MSSHHPPDRLYRLSTYRLALRSCQLTTPESVLRATAEQLAGLAHRAEIVKIVRAGDPDVLRALFLPRVPLNWSVAGFDYDPYLRLLSVSRGSVMLVSEQLVDHLYRVDDDGSAERGAWTVLRDTLRAGVGTAAARE